MAAHSSADAHGFPVHIWPAIPRQARVPHIHHSPTRCTDDGTLEGVDGSGAAASRFSSPAPITLSTSCSASPGGKKRQMCPERGRALRT